MQEIFTAVYDHLYVYIGAWMFLVLALTLFTGIPVPFALGGVATATALLAIKLEFLEWPVFYQVVQRVYGGDGGSGAIQNPILVAIPCFVFMGTMLEKSKVAVDLLNILQVMLRRVPGGLALSVTVMGTIMAATTGIIGASVVMITLLALPTMLARGYSPALATGTIAASSTLGILIPPSIMLVLMANLLAVSVGNLFIGAIFPGLILSGLYFAYILVFAVLRPSAAPAMREDEINLDPINKRNLVAFVVFIIACIALSKTGNWLIWDGVNWTLVAFILIFLFSSVMGRREGNTLLGGILKGFVPPVFLIVIVLGSIFAGWATPTEAAGVGAMGSMVLAWMNRTLTMDVMRAVVNRTTLTTAMIFFIFVGATAFSTIFRNVYGEDLIIEFIEHLALSPWALLFMLMGVIFIMGFFFDFLEITLIILPVFAPIIRHLAPAFASHIGMEGAPLAAMEAQTIYWFAIVVAVNLQTSFLTPPFGFALFYLKGVAPKSVTMQQIYTGIVPFVMLQLIGLGLVLAYPQIALWLPDQILGR
ncbi:MAG: TRAP transporter large permease subunit [Rhodobacteraceae bacterium]|nr:TRAP transporter large permease subunit [Paracoccaceae bacterium]